MELWVIVVLPVIFAFTMYGIWSFVRDMKLDTLYSDVKNYMEKRNA